MDSIKVYSGTNGITITKASSLIDDNSQKENTLNIECLAIVEGQKSPTYCPINGSAFKDADGNLVLLEYTKDIIKGYANNFKEPIDFNINHQAKTYAGKITGLNIVDVDGKVGLAAKGVIDNPEWVSKILKDDFKGISIETTTNLIDNNQSFLTAISLLQDFPPACNKELCSTKILNTASSSKEVIRTMIDVINTKAWSGPDAEKRLLDYSRDKNDNIVASKIRKYFLRVDNPTGADGEYVRENFGYPCGDIIDGKPQYVLGGLIAALQRSAGEGVDYKSKIRRIIIRNFGVESLPPSLKSKASLFLIESDIQGDDLMKDSDDETKIIPILEETKAAEKPAVPQVEGETKPEPKIENPAVVKEPEAVPKKEEVITPVVEVIKTEVKVETPVVEDIPKIETPITPIVAAKASTEVITPEAKTPEVKSKVVFTKAQMDEIVKVCEAPSFEAAADIIMQVANLQSSVDNKAGQWEVDSLQRQLNDAKEEICELKEFKESVEEKELMDALPRGVWEGVVDINGEVVPKIKMIAKEIREGGVSTMLKYVKGAASASIVNGKASETDTSKPKEIKTKGSSESTEIEPEGASKKAAEIKAVKDFQTRYMHS